MCYNVFMALLTISKSCADGSKEFESQPPTESYGLVTMPVEIFARISPLLTTEENVRLLQVSTTVWGYKDTLEQTYRLDLKGRIDSIFSSITSSFTTDVLTVKNGILAVIDGMTFKTSQAVKEKCGSDLDSLVTLLMPEYNGLPVGDQTRELKGLKLADFIASRPNMARFAFQNADVRKLLRSTFATSNRIPLPILDKVLVQKINFLADNGNAAETETMIALVERGPLRDGLRAKIIAKLVRQNDLVTASRFFNAYPLSKDSLNEIIEAAFESCTMDEMCAFAKGIRSDFRKEVFARLIAAGCLNDAQKLIEETPEGAIKTYMQNVMLGKNCEALAKEDRVDEVLAFIRLHYHQNQTKTLKSVALIFAFDDHFGSLIQVLNMLSEDLVFMKEIVKHINSDSLVKAQTFAEGISDLNVRKRYELEIQAKLSLLPLRPSPS